MWCYRLVERLIEPQKDISGKKLNFSNRDLKLMIVPLLIEQLLVVLVGLADTLMISYAGEEAVSGVSLVNLLITVFIFVFSALSSGGAVVVSQYIGSRSKENGNLAAGQLLVIVSIIAVFFTVVILYFATSILEGLYGAVEPAVMEASLVYLRISVYSFIPLGVYNVGAAIYRSMGKTNVTMRVSIFMNVLNIIGNFIGIFVLKAGVAGVAWPTFLARTLAAVVMIYLCFDVRNTVYLERRRIVKFQPEMIVRILKIAVPSSIENGILQLAKVVLGAIVALFGTTQIAANGVAQSFWSLAALVGTAMAPAFITVVGQCMGAGDKELADYYVIKLLRITYLISITWNFIIMALTPVALIFYNLAPETKELIIMLVVLHNSFNAFIFPLSLPLANGLRAAGDAKFTMAVSIFSTVLCRFILSYFFAIAMNLGVFGVAFAMISDWAIRALFNWQRYKSQNWLLHQVIEA